MIAQKTLKNSVRATGVGLHSGRQVELRIIPAAADSGIVFRRTDVSGSQTDQAIKACASNVADTDMSTTLSNGVVRVATVEHLMAAFAGLGIDNATVELNAAELPIMDGSAAPYVFLLQAAGLVTQGKPRTFLRILQDVQYVEGDSSVKLEPYAGIQMSYTLAFDHPAFRDQIPSVTLELGELGGSGRQVAMASERFEKVFIKEVCRARTFGFLEDIDRLRARNLAQGGSLDNAVVMDSVGIMNVDGLRQKDEFAKHKILDAIGDLYLLGRPIIGAFTGHKTGHRANNALLRLLLADPTNFETITLSGPSPSSPSPSSPSPSSWASSLADEML